MAYVEYTNSQIIHLIDEHIHNALYREVLKDRFVNGLTLEKIAEKHDISVRHTKNIIYRHGNKLLTKL